MCVSVHMRVCVDICLCIRVCGHPSVCVCVDICHVCVRATVCPSVYCVLMRVRGHLRVCASVCVCGHVRASVCHYNFVMLMCTIFVLTIIVQFGIDIQYIMIWKV